MNKLSQLTRLANTIRPLKPSQIYWRGRYMLARRLPARPTSKPKAVDYALSPAMERHSAFGELPLFHFVKRPAATVVNEMSQGVFYHLNQRQDVGHAQPDWKLGPCSEHRLWVITLHYHIWCYELADIFTNDPTQAQQAESLLVHYLSNWLTNCSLNAPGSRALAWNSFACSTRISWWIRTYQSLDTAFWKRHPELEKQFLTSLWQQADHVSHHLEWDLRGNHLMRNAVGLAWASRFFTGPDAKRWSQVAHQIANSQLEEQILTDGGHFERSPMYHIHIMEDVMSLALLLEDEATKEKARNVWQQMANYLHTMRHPDGEIPLFNDAALNAVTPAAEMLSYGTILNCATTTDIPTGGRYLKETGIAAWHGDPWTLFVDVGEVGPDCQPGHSHADTLSLECSYNNTRLIVDPGTFSYDRDDIRAHDRSTAAHNTVCIDGTNSSDVWDIFRLGTRAKPDDITVTFNDNQMSLVASHDGYNNLTGQPKHTRIVETINQSHLQITDTIENQQSEHDIAGGYLIAPSWNVTPTETGWHISNNADQLIVSIQSNQKIELKTAQQPYHPEYGREEQATRISWHWKGCEDLEVTTQFYATQPTLHCPST